MNVLYLTMNPNRQSTTVPTEGWLRLLPELGLQPVLVSREQGTFHEWARKQGIPAYQDLLPFPNKAKPIPLIRSLWHLRKIVRRHRIELIHCNEQNIYPIGQYLGMVCKLPVVVSIHFTMDSGFCTWAFGGRKAPRRIIFTSQGNLDACRAGVEGSIPENRWRLLYNGVDLKRYRPDAEYRDAFRRQYLIDGDIAIGVACATRPRKQLEHLFEVAFRIADNRLKVIVAGGPIAGDETYACRLFEAARERLGNRLILLGHLDDLVGFYNGLDIYVNTSQEEACSLAVIECLGSGCPILGYPSRSVDDQILPEGGEIVPQDDVDRLTDALNRWIADPDELARRREPARNRAEKMFDIRQRSVQLWDEYCDVLSEWKSMSANSVVAL